MAVTRRSFLGAAGLGIAGAALSPLIRVRRALAAHEFRTHRVVIVGIAGGLRNIESLGLAQGATMPNHFGRVPILSGYGAEAKAPPVIAPEYAAQTRPLVLPAPRPAPLYTEGTLIANLRYAEGAPGHLQGQACLLSGYYNNLENRADARLPVPTIFELHRRESNQPATDSWYLSTIGGFYRALQSGAHPEFGARYGGRFLSPPGVMSAVLPLVTSGTRSYTFGGGAAALPTIPIDRAADAATRRLTSVIDGNTADYETDSANFRATAAENQALQEHIAEYYGDPSYESFYPDSMGIGVAEDGGGLDSTGDALTVYHAEQILAKFKPGVMCVTLIDTDACHADFNGYLRGQEVADACVAHLWDFIQNTEGLRDQTTLIVLPEHGRHLFHNGQNPDSLGRSGIDHGIGDDGDRDVWMLALGPDIKPNQVIEPTGIAQVGRSSGRYETIDAVRSAMSLLGHGELMKSTIEGAGGRPGLVIEEMLR